MQPFPSLPAELSALLSSVCSNARALIGLLDLIVIDTVVRTLYFLDEVLNGFGLSLPFLCRHLLLLEHPVLREAVGAAETVEGSEELTIVDLETGVVERVASSAVYDGIVAEVFAIMDENSPEVDEDEEDNTRPLLHGENEGEDVVRQALAEAVDRVKGVAREGCGHDPFVVSLVEVLVDARVMQIAVNPVNAEVGEEKEDRKL